MSFVEFLLEYYVYILIVLVLMIITIIGFLADKRDKKKKKSKKDANVGDNVSVNANNTNVGGNVSQPMENIAPTPLQPQNLDVNMNNANMNTAINSNVNPNMGMNSGISSQNIMEQPLIREDVPNQVASTPDTNSDVNSLGYKPLDEQKPKIAPRPVEIPSENAMGNVDSNLGNAGVTPNVNPTPTPVAPNMNQIPVMEQSTMSVNPTSTVNQTFNPEVGANVTPSAQNPQTQASVDQTPVTNPVPETPVVNSWDVNPTPSVNPTMTEPTMGQTVNPMPSTNNMASAPMQPNVNPVPINVGNNVSQPASQVAPAPQAQPQQQASGMNFVYGQETPTNANNQVNNNQDLWKL